jgi:hypothetical protein
MFNRLKAIFSSKPAITDPYEHFVVEFVEECKRQGRRLTSYDHQERSFVLNDREDSHGTVYLENCFREWMDRNAKGRSELLTRFVRSTADLINEVSLADLQEQLMPGIRSRVLISDMLIRNWSSDGPDDTSEEIASKPFCNDVASVLLLDRSDTLKPLQRSDLVRANISFDAAMTVAMDNLRAKTRQPDFEPLDGGELFFCSNLEDHQSGLLLLIPGKDFQFPPLDGDPVALAPSRNRFFVTGSRNRLGLKVLLQFAEAAREEAHYCSATLLIWRNGSWEEFAFQSGTPEAERQRDIDIRERGLDYQNQKNLLDQLHERRKQDVFTSPFEVFQPTGQLKPAFSVTFLPSSAIGALLPVAERISLIDQVVDPSTGLAKEEPRDRVVVAWSDTLAIAGHLFEPVPHLYPPRYRALGFPDAYIWQKLKAKAFA